MSAVAMTVNGKAVTGDVDPRTLLVQFLREHLRLTGTHVGCDTSQCGACVVHVNGKAVKACTVFAWQAEGADVLTIEGLAEPSGPLHPMQEAFREHHGLQCGYCTPGMIMTAVDMVYRKGNDLDDHTIRHELEGNLCRCTGYHNIVKAIAAGARSHGKGHVTVIRRQVPAVRRGRADDFAAPFPLSDFRLPTCEGVIQGGDGHERNRHRRGGTPQRGPAVSLPARATLPTTSTVPARPTRISCALRMPMPGSSGSTPRRLPACRACSRCLPVRSSPRTRSEGSSAAG